MFYNQCLLSLTRFKGLDWLYVKTKQNKTIVIKQIKRKTLWLKSARTFFYLFHIKMSGSKKARLVRQLHSYTILNSYCPATCHLQCAASQSKWIVLASAITSKFQEEAGWRERRKDRFTSFKKITWYSHTSLLVDSH